jgi:hypothetical protein
MPVVSDQGWAAVNQRRKAKRDEVRKRFQSDVGVVPGKSIADWSSAPQEQMKIVTSLIQKTLTSPDRGIKEGLAGMMAALGQAGLGAGAMGGTSSTQLDLDAMMPSSLIGTHFSSLFGERD